jgi:hypothetical protein
LIFDCWAVHKQAEFLKACSKSGFKVVFVPAGYTDHLQPMDLAINKIFKDNIRNLFDEFLVTQLSEKFQNSENLENSELPITLPQLKSKIIEWCDISASKIIIENKAVQSGNV